MSKTKISKLSLVFVLLFGLAIPLVSAVSILPKEILDIFLLFGPSGICATEYINGRVQFILFLALGLLVLISVIYALLAAFKYIRSEGDPGEMEKAQKSIKAIFFGIAAMLIAIVGIVLVFVVFGATPTNPELFQVCITAPESDGCEACRTSTNDKLCNACEEAYKKICRDQRNNSLTDQELKELIEAAASAVDSTVVPTGGAPKCYTSVTKN